MTSYKIGVDFARELVLLVCTSPTFYNRIGRNIHHDLMPDRNHGLVVRAAHDLAEATGRGPTCVSAVLERLRVRQRPWKMTQECLDEVLEVLEELEEGFLTSTPDLEETVANLEPHVSRKLYEEAEELWFNVATKQGEVDAVISKLEQVKHVGVAEEEMDLELGQSLTMPVKDARNKRRCTLGIGDIDEAIRPGLRCSSFNLALAGTGGGKTAWLSQLAAHYTLSRKDGLYLSCEVGADDIDARILAAMTDVLEQPLTDGDAVARKEALARLDVMRHRGMVGNVRVQKHKRNALTPTAMRERVDRHEQRTGTQIDWLLIDYLDLMSSGGNAGHDKDIWRKNEYLGNYLCDYAEEKGLWIHSVSQINAGEPTKNRKREAPNGTKIQQARGGQAKVNIATFVMSINVSDRQESVFFEILKYRNGPGNFRTAELPCDFKYGRVTQPTLSWNTLQGRLG